MMNISKIEYKITTSIKGTCPHCKEAINTETIEELSDDMPPQEYFNRRVDALKQSIDDYDKFIIENPTYINLNNLMETWRQRVEALQVRSSIKSESIYVFTGDCPYCNKNIDLRKVMLILNNMPPRLRDDFQEEKTLIEWLQILKDKDLSKMSDPSQDTHFMEKCPLCGETIHLTNGEFYKKSDCPDHNIDLTDAKMELEP